MKNKKQTIICEVCNKESPKRGNGIQKYCIECSKKKDLERKRKWSKENPRPNEYYKRQHSKKREKVREKGQEINKEEAKNINWYVDTNDEMDTIVKVAVPFQYGMSKNAAWSMSRKGHVHLRKNHRNLRDMLTMKIKLACRHVEFYEDKLWVDIFVQKPDHRGDAVNVVDAVCDAIKHAIPVDDRWYSIRRLDWQITKEKPMLYVGIGQKSDGHKRACSTCGRILKLDRFNKNKSDRLGVGRECKDCRSGRYTRL